MKLLRFDDHAHGRVFHAAQVSLTGRPSGPGLHGHADYYEFMGVVDGSGEHVLGHGSHRLESGDVVLVRPTDAHEMIGTVTFVNVAFPAAAWRTFVDLCGLDPERWEAPAAPPRFSLHGMAATAMRNAFGRALARYRSSLDTSPTRLDLVRFWTDVLEAIGTEPHPTPGDDRFARPRPEWLERACEAMRSEQNLRGGVRRLLDLSHVSAAHLSRTMREHYGRTPTQFVTELRIARAAELLVTTLLSVTEIAHRCGFASQSYFTRCFQQLRGVSPRTYRRQAVRAFVP